RPITLYASGTAALARALARCAARATVGAPEAILPAYGCPDLVAACVHASVHPRLVDIAASGWAFDTDGLLGSLSSRTVAIVSVNLLGIPDGTLGLTDLCRRRGIALIQDSAQFLPRQPIEWPGDYVILSFGRGKPLNLLHGGALIEPMSAIADSMSHPASDSFRDRLVNSSAAGLAFNFLTRPHPYRLLSCLPGTGLGQVDYKPL
ncbi:DegT/DnrJ/EryC1/StrS aminotransferase, partial [mine drainage metagenome]